MKIIKRSGVEEAFDNKKIIAAIRKANDSVIDYEKIDDEQIKDIAKNVEIACENMKRSASVEEIQDMVPAFRAACARRSCGLYLAAALAAGLSKPNL